MRTSGLIFGCILVILALLLSCSDKGVQPAPRTSTFPLTAGSSWHYRYSSHLIPTRHPSDSTVNTWEMYRKVLGPSRYSDSLQAMTVIDSVRSESSSNYTHIYWQGISDSKLVEYASSSTYNGRYFDTLIYDVPLIVLDFPLNVGKGWSGLLYGGYDSYCRVIGISPIEIADRTFDCDIIEGKLYSEIPEIDDSNIVRQYYCDQGMIYSTIDDGYRVSFDSTGHQTDSARSITYINLLDYQINK
jgi:hypothetical protein